jgi:hypothetical protein
VRCLRTWLARSLTRDHSGKDVGLAGTENRDGVVSDRVLSKLNLQTPSSELVDLYLFEIAKAYGLSWRPESMKDEDVPGGDVPAVRSLSLAYGRPVDARPADRRPAGLASAGRRRSDARDAFRRAR